MTKDEALWIMQLCRDRDARDVAEREAYDTAIEALEHNALEEKLGGKIKFAIKRKERGMTYTKAEPIKRYCKSKQVMCELANELGYCKITACVNQSSLQNTAKCLKGE